MSDRQLIDHIASLIAAHGGPQWRDPVIVPSVDPPIDGDPGDSQNNWGRQDTITGGIDPARHTMIDLRFRESRPMTILSAITKSAGTAVNSDGITITPHPWLVIEMGNGSTNIQRLARVDDYMEIPVTASYLRVRAYLGDANGKPFPLSSYLDPLNPPSMQIAVFASKGIRGLPGVNVIRSISLSNPTPKGLWFNVPREVFAIFGHLTTAAGSPRFLQIFDNNVLPVNGDVPVMEYILNTTPGPPESGERFINPVGFSLGVTFACSSTSGVLTLAAEAVTAMLETWSV